MPNNDPLVMNVNEVADYLRVAPATPTDLPNREDPLW